MASITLLLFFDLCSVVSVCAFINSDKVLNNENSMKIKQLANPFQSTCTSCNLACPKPPVGLGKATCNQVSYSTNLPSQ